MMYSNLGLSFHETLPLSRKSNLVPLPFLQLLKILLILKFFKFYASNFLFQLLYIYETSPHKSLCVLKELWAIVGTMHPAGKEILLVASRQPFRDTFPLIFQNISGGLPQEPVPAMYVCSGPVHQDDDLFIASYWYKFIYIYICIYIFKWIYLFRLNM